MQKNNEISGDANNSSLNTASAHETSKEIWKDIPGYEGLYQASSLGRIRSVTHIVRAGKNKQRHVNSKILSPWKTLNGYLHVSLGRNKKVAIHRLVALAFISNPDSLPCVNHKDECKTNNVFSNLEWCDKSYNALYGACQDKLRRHKNQPVRIYDKVTNLFIKEFESIKIAMNETGVHAVTISQVCRGLRKSTGGYIWKYAERCI